MCIVKLMLFLYQCMSYYCKFIGTKVKSGVGSIVLKTIKLVMTFVHAITACME